MPVNIGIWGIVTFPLTMLVWLHRLYVSALGLLMGDRALDEAWDRLARAETFEQWEAAGRALDHQYRMDAWRRDDKSAAYAWELISERLAAFALALQAGHVQALVHLLQSGLVRNLGNMTAPALYNASFCGTKYLIENYILQVCEIIRDLVVLPGDKDADADLLSPDLARAVRDGRCEPRLSAPAKRQLFSNLRQSFGRTTLVFQGGSIFGVCHLGVARALFGQGLLPRIVTGTGTGALMAALLGTHTDAELPAVLDGDAIDLSAFAVHHHHGPGTSRLRTALRRAARFWREGYFLDVAVLERCVRDNGGHLTFEEAFRRTGRILNITVVSGGGDVPALLNYVTAPNVLIWTAAVASNASDTAWYHGQPPTPLLCKDAAGRVVPWPRADTARFRHWTAGGAAGGRAPLQRLAQLFNVNHFVVSQARPYLVPFLEPSLHSPAARRRGRRRRRRALGAALEGARALVRRQIGRFVRHRLAQLAALGWLPAALRRLLLDEQVPGGGGAASLVLVPPVGLHDYVRLLDPPTRASLRYWIRKGETAVWPSVAALKIRCCVELALEQACTDLEVTSEGVLRGGG